MESMGLARFLFEIASEERLGILGAIAGGPLKHGQIARRLDMTGSEATRHLARLSAVGLVTRNPRGEYEPTNLARLAAAPLESLRFVTAHRPYLLAHDLLGLPPEFVERVGALSGATSTVGVYRVVATQERYLRAVGRRIWVLTDQAFEQALPILREKASGGADVRVIRPLGAFEASLERNYPVRLLEEVRVFLAVLDDAAGVCFPSLDGRVDMATMLLLQDPQGYRWAEDLFLHFWDRARAWPSGPPSGGRKAPR